MSGAGQARPGRGQTRSLKSFLRRKCSVEQTWSRRSARRSSGGKKPNF